MDFKSWFLAVQEKMAAEVPKEETIDEKKKYKEILLSKPFNELVDEYYSMGYMLHGLTRDKLVELLDYLVSINLATDEMKNVLLKKYATLDIKDWGLCRKKLSDGSNATVLSAGFDSLGNKVEFEDFDTEYGVSGYVYNEDVPQFSEAGSVVFVFIKDAYCAHSQASYFV